MLIKFDAAAIGMVQVAALSRLMIVVPLHGGSVMMVLWTDDLRCCDVAIYEGDFAELDVCCELMRCDLIVTFELPLLGPMVMNLRVIKGQIVVAVWNMKIWFNFRVQEFFQLQMFPSIFRLWRLSLKKSSEVSMWNFEAQRLKNFGKGWELF